MKQASTEAYAKINLTLDVTGKRPNGYHDVCMVMQSIGIHDIVTVQTETGADDIELTISHCDLPTDSSNLAYRAAQLFLQRTNKQSNGIRIHIEKHNPIAAGLAGGSTDAAPTGWLDEILPIDPDEDEYMPWCWDDLVARKPFTTRQDFEDVRNLVKRQIQYDDLLKNQWKYNRERLDEIVEIMVELHTTPEAAIRISGREWPAWAIQDRLKKLTYDSLMTVYYNLDRTKNDIRNIKNYLIATLMNTPITQESQFTAEYRAHPV